MYRKNFRPMPEPEFPKGPENPSTATTLYFGELRFDRSFENKKTFELFKINKQAIVGSMLKVNTSFKVPVTEQNLRDALEKGKRFRDLFLPDGPPRPCAICFNVKQPVTTTFFYQKDEKEVEGKGGNFFTRSELVIREDTPPETQEGANKLTAEVFGGKIPEDLLSRILHICRQCQYTVNKTAEKNGKEWVFTRGFNFSQAKERLLEASERISLAIGRSEAKNRAENVGAKLAQRSRSFQTESGQREEQPQPKEEKVEYPEESGAFWFKTTGEKIRQAVEDGMLDSDDPLGAICDMSPRQIFELGFVEFEGQAPFVQGIAIAAKKRQEDAAAVSRVKGTGTVPLGVAAEHHEREKQSRKKKFREPIRNKKHDYSR